MELLALWQRMWETYRLQVEVKETGRIEAFSDGVFAIAITLLVLDLKVPSEPPLLQGLAREWPVYVAYLISFVFVLIMWINHHWMFEHIVRIDSTFMLLNGMLLLGITVVPFPTSIASQYVLTSEQTVATVVYSGWFLLISIFFNVLWQYASRRGRLLRKDAYESGLVKLISKRYQWGIPSYSAAFVLAFVWPPASLALIFVLAVVYAWPRDSRMALSSRR